MCQTFSFVLLRNGAILSSIGSDSHSNILAENNLIDNETGDFVRLEYIPPSYLIEKLCGDKPLTPEECFPPCTLQIHLNGVLSTLNSWEGWNLHIDEEKHPEWLTERAMQSALNEIHRRIRSIFIFPSGDTPRNYSHRLLVLTPFCSVGILSNCRIPFTTSYLSAYCLSCCNASVLYKSVVQVIKRSTIYRVSDSRIGSMAYSILDVALGTLIDCLTFSTVRETFSSSINDAERCDFGEINESLISRADQCSLLLARNSHIDPVRYKRRSIIVRNGRRRPLAERKNTRLSLTGAHKNAFLGVINFNPGITYAQLTQARDSALSSLKKETANV